MKNGAIIARKSVARRARGPAETRGAFASRATLRSIVERCP